MFPHAMGGLALPALNFHAAYGIPPKKDEKKKDPPPEDDAPFTYDYYGRPMALQDDMSQAKLYMHQVLNCPYPWVDEYVQRQVKLLMDSACKDAVVRACTRFIACRGVYSLRVLQILHHVPDEKCVDMLEYLDMLSDPGRADWHFNQGEIILLAHKHKKRAKDYKTKDDDTKWKAFTDVVGKPRITWPSPPDPIGWTFDQMYPWWDGKEENIPDHMMQVLLPKYMMGCAHMPKP